MINSKKELIEIFNELQDWEQKYSFIIELGEELKPLSEEFLTPQYKVTGCQSNVWLVPEVKEEKDGTLKIHFQSYSDSQIVRGLIFIVQIIFNNKTPEQILNTDIEKIFNDLSLKRHLSPNRSNGLMEIVKKIKQLASYNK